MQTEGQGRRVRDTSLAGKKVPEKFVTSDLKEVCPLCAGDNMSMCADGRFDLQYACMHQLLRHICVYASVVVAHMRVCISY